MVKKIRVATKKKEPVVTENVTDVGVDTDVNNVSINADTKNNIANSTTPTCIRLYIDNESALQYVNAMMMKFNAENKTQNILSLQRVGYKLNANNTPSEIDMAILHHKEGCVISPEEYTNINNHLTTNLEMNGIRYQFIDFADSYRNTSDTAASRINYKNESVTDYITLEKGSVTDELFEFLCTKYIGIYEDIIQSIRIPITECSFTFKTEWVKVDKRDESNADDVKKSEDSQVKEADRQESAKNDNEIMNVTICIYDVKASDDVDRLLSQFAKSIGNKVYDYTEQTPNKYFRVININVIPDINGTRLIDSFGWVNNIAVAIK